MPPKEEYTVITSGQTATATAEQEEQNDRLSPDERAALAGLDNETQALISPENRLDPDVVAVKRDISRSPISRTVFVLCFVGVFVLFGAGIVLLTGLGRKRSPEVASSPPAAESDIINPSDADLYRGRLALAEQQNDQAPTPAASTPGASPRPTPTRSPNARPTPTPSAATPTRTSRATSDPAPRTVRSAPVREPQTRIVERTVPASPSPAQPARPQPEEDPMDQWNRLANLGTAYADVEQEVSRSGQGSDRSISSSDGGEQEQAIADTQTITPAAAVRSNSSTTQSAGFASDVIGDDSTFESSQAEPTAVLVASAAGAGDLSRPVRRAGTALTPGARGILQQQDLGSTPAVGSNMQVAIGTSAAAEVTIPMYWESGSSDESARFAVMLTEPLRSTTGEVALPEGTIFVTQASVSSDESRIVNQTVVAVVYQAPSGEIRQEAVQPGTIVVRGEGNEPLIAARQRRSNFGNDLMLGLMGAAGRVGELLNQGDLFESSSSAGGSNGGSSTSVTRRSGDTNVTAAALDGFFNPLVERAQERAAAREEEQQNSANILMVEEGESVSVIVNGILEVSP